MRRYQTKEVQEISKIICNKCGKEIVAENGHFSEDVLQVEKRWGYPSDKDNEVHTFDLCEECYDAFVKTFLIPVEVR